jgi:probable F420-dependent oxidoreductase
VAGDVVRTSGYQLRLPAPRSTITVAAFGPHAVRVAARHADRMVLALVTLAGAERLAAVLQAESQAAGTSPRLAAWVPVAVDAGDEAREQLRRMLVSYVAAPGYGEMFGEAGFSDVVALARTRAHPREVLAAIPDGLVDAIAILGDASDVRRRVAEFAEHVDELVVLPCSTGADPGGVQTLQTLSELAAGEASSLERLPQSNPDG